jgi:hypothetical protein
MAFGKKQFFNPTPASANNAVSAISALCGVLGAWLQTVDFIPDKTVKIISGILGLIIGISQAMRPFFGQEITTKTVPAEQVTGIDTTK